MVLKKQTIEGHQIVFHRCKRFNDILFTLIQVFYTSIDGKICGNFIIIKIYCRIIMFNKKQFKIYELCN